VPVLTAEQALQELRRQMVVRLAGE